MAGTTPEQAAATMVTNRPETTGKSLEQWLWLFSDQTFDKHGGVDRKEWLKKPVTSHE